MNLHILLNILHLTTYSILSRNGVRAWPGSELNWSLPDVMFVFFGRLSAQNEIIKCPVNIREVALFS